jgi:hypothetical protein
MTTPTRSDLVAAFYAALATADPTDPAAVIRAAVEVVLPEEEDLPRAAQLDFFKQLQRDRTRAQLLVLADALQPWEEQAEPDPTPTTPDPWEALREAQQALIWAAASIWSHEGHSAAYRAAANAADRARDALLVRLQTTNPKPPN